ncbi:MAG: hypothetical protein C5B53_05340 [Candidatus Melainabacteria bacterium]|nr:MAG: hypothetical protein C5B53_05340 [Candidatus Melainabacteria bacterium]
MYRCICSRERGAALVDAAVGFAAIFPFLLVVCLVMVEASYAYIINRNMQQGACLAARGLAFYYQSNPEVVTTPAEQQAIFSSVRIPGYVADNSQFSIPQGGWNTAGTPPTVTVVCTYIPGKGTPPLASFPNPDPLGLGSAYRVSCPATYRLQ